MNFGKIISNYIHIISILITKMKFFEPRLIISNHKYRAKMMPMSNHRKVKVTTTIIDLAKKEKSRDVKLINQTTILKLTKKMLEFVRDRQILHFTRFEYPSYESFINYY